MKKYTAGEWTKAGAYWGLKTGEFVTVPRGGGLLPGDENRQYVKAPLGLVIVVGPVMGLLFLIFLPLLGIVGLATFGGRRLAQKAAEGRQSFVQARMRARLAGPEDMKTKGTRTPPKKEDPDQDRWDDIARW